MKSIVEEASSIAKAIENGWIRAGKPQEFSIRIFEEPEKNFFGFTKKPAKVGIFYKEIPIQHPGRGKEQKQQHHIKQRGSQERLQQQQKQPISTTSIQKQQAASIPQGQSQISEQQRQPKWTPQLIDGSEEWLRTILKTIHKESAPFTLEHKQYFLIIRFETPVTSDKRKEQLLFKSWSHLLLQALRHRFKRGLRGYKIIITSAA